MTFSKRISEHDKVKQNIVDAAVKLVVFWDATVQNPSRFCTNPREHDLTCELAKAVRAFLELSKASKAELIEALHTLRVHVAPTGFEHAVDDLIALACRLPD